MSFESQFMTEGSLSRRRAIPPVSILSVMFMKELPSIIEVQKLLRSKLLRFYRFRSVPVRERSKKNKVRASWSPNSASYPSPSNSPQRNGFSSSSSESSTSSNEGSGPWVWEERKDIDLNHHIIERTVESSAVLQMYIDSIIYRNWSFDHPLWYIHLVENLEAKNPNGDTKSRETADNSTRSGPPHQNMCAIIFEVHHGLADGLSIFQLSMNFFTDVQGNALVTKRSHHYSDGISVAGIPTKPSKESLISGSRGVSPSHSVSSSPSPSPTPTPLAPSPSTSFVSPSGASTPNGLHFSEPRTTTTTNTNTGSPSPPNGIPLTSTTTSANVSSPTYLHRRFSNCSSARSSIRTRSSSAGSASSSSVPGRRKGFVTHAKEKIESFSAMSAAYLKISTLPFLREDSDHLAREKIKSPQLWNPRRVVVFFPPIPISSSLTALMRQYNMTMEGILIAVLGGTFRRYLKYRKDPLLAEADDDSDARANDAAHGHRALSMAEGDVCSLNPVKRHRKKHIRIRALNPQMLHRPQDGDQHNNFTLISLDLPVGWETPLDRLRAAKVTADRIFEPGSVSHALSASMSTASASAVSLASPSATSLDRTRHLNLSMSSFSTGKSATAAVSVPKKTTSDTSPSLSPAYPAVANGGVGVTIETSQSMIPREDPITPPSPTPTITKSAAANAIAQSNLLRFMRSLSSLSPFSTSSYSSTSSASSTSSLPQRLAWDYLRKHTFSFTHLPAFDSRVYLCGKPVAAIVPVTSALQSTMASVSYGGELWVSLTCDDRKVIVDPEKFVEFFLEEVNAVAGLVAEG
ncbi:hypothetical protein HK102_006174 [Quaeritorhiza haematococci]|nr:hypothetical protein HK102_006174 [Quaeritorhiza haematococci]